MTYTRADGVQLPDNLMADLRYINLEDGMNKTDAQLADEFVLFTPYRMRPANHPQSYPRLTVDVWKNSTQYKRSQHKMTDKQIAAAIEDFCAPDWVRFNLQADTECPNCLGKKGQGVFRIRAGSPKSGLLVYPKRELIEHPCPVCAGQYTYTAALEFCGLDMRIITARKDEEPWWNFADGQRIAVERVVQDMLDAVVNRKIGGQWTIIGPPGCGKTWLLEWLTVKIAVAGQRIKYVEWGEAERLISAHVSDGQFTAPPIVQTMMTVPVLIIDQFEKVQELNAGGDASFSARMIREVIHARYKGSKDGGKMATLVAVNRAAWQESGRKTLVDVYDRLRDGMWGETELASVRASLGTDAGQESES